MNQILQRIIAKKQQLDQYRPLPPALVKNLDDWFRVELTYTSNAIEGNTLSRQETALVVEKGLTVEGKTLREHLEAVNHASALDFIGGLVGKRRAEFGEQDVLAIHQMILQSIDNLNAGRFRTVSVRIAGSTVIMPTWVKVPDLMDEFYTWLHQKSEQHPVWVAADAHYHFVSIHPFVDGNGRTARLLMNLLLMQEGYPPALIRKEDRRRYISSIEQGQLGGSLDDYYQVIGEAVERSLDIYLQAVEPEHRSADQGIKLLKIGELAKASGENAPTLRYWTQLGLLTVVGHTTGGYQLYSSAMIERIQLIRNLQETQRLTLDEIKQRL